MNIKRNTLKIKEEIKKWMEQAIADFDTAKVNFEGKRYYVCAYLSHQAVEKALKTLLLKKGDVFIRTHNLVVLGRQINLPKDILKKCEQLSGVYIETKYGSIGDYVPSQKFKKQNSSEYLEIANEVILWVKKNMYIF